MMLFNIKVSFFWVYPKKIDDNYGKFESGNKVSLQHFHQYLKKIGSKVNFMDDCLPKIKVSFLK